MQTKNKEVVEKTIEGLKLYLKITQDQELAKELKVSKATVAGWRRNGRITKSGRIITMFPDINLEWLKTGEGPMLRTDRPQDGHRAQGDIGVVKQVNSHQQSGSSVQVGRDHTIQADGRLAYSLTPLEASLIDAIRKKDTDDKLIGELLVQTLQK